MLIGAILLGTSMIAGCGGADVTFVSNGATYTLEQVEELHASQPVPSSLAGRPTADSSELRRDALVELRSQGGEAADVAEFVTTTLADTGRAVLYYAESATVEGVASWVLLEAWGPEGGTLEYTRLWVFERESGAVVYSSTSR